MLQGIDQLVPKINSVLSGETSVQVQVNISPNEMLLLGGIIFLAMFAAVVLGMLVTMKYS